MNFPANSSQSTQKRSCAIRSELEGKAMIAFSGPSVAINWLKLWNGREKEEN
jgi:hypothetical protein